MDDCTELLHPDSLGRAFVEFTDATRGISKAIEQAQGQSRHLNPVELAVRRKIIRGSSDRPGAAGPLNWDGDGIPENWARLWECSMRVERRARHQGGHTYPDSRASAIRRKANLT